MIILAEKKSHFSHILFSYSLVGFNLLFFSYMWPSYESMYYFLILYTSNFIIILNNNIFKQEKTDIT